MRYRHTDQYDTKLEITAANIPYYTGINKFGRNTSVGTTRQDVWTGGGIYNWSTTANITHIVSSSASDTFQVEVQGLDADWLLVTQTKTLTGTTGVALDTPLIRVFRMKNNSASLAVGTIQVGVGAVTSAFTTTNKRGQINIGFGQTLMALYTIPADCTGYLTNVWGSINKANTNGALDTILWARSFGGVFRVQKTTGLIAGGASLFKHDYNPYPKYSAKTDIRVSATGSTSGFDVSGGFDIILVKDE